MLGAGDAAEDAAQEAMLRAWRQRAKCRDPAHPAPWLRRIATNEALRIASSRRQDISLDAAGWDAGAEAEEPGYGIFARDLVNRLNPADRRLIYLQYWADISIRDIAQRVRMPEGTVKIRLHRARASLMQMLEDES